MSLARVGVPAYMLGGAMRLCDSDQGRPVLRFKDGCEGGVLESVAGCAPTKLVAGRRGHCGLRGLVCIVASRNYNI